VAKATVATIPLSADLLHKSPIRQRIVETFFKSIKADLIWQDSWETPRQTEGAIFQYINGSNNPRRRHSSLSGKSPLAFERKAA
jgi:transposase InsO family protein